MYILAGVSKMVPIRWDESDLERIDAAAASAGLKRAAFIRQAALREAGHPASVTATTGSPTVIEVLTGDATPRPRVKAAKECRHGYTSCRVCKTGRYA